MINSSFLEHGNDWTTFWKNMTGSLKWMTTPINPYFVLKNGEANWWKTRIPIRGLFWELFSSIQKSQRSHPAKCQQQQTLWVLIGMPWKLRKEKEGGNGGGEDEVDLCTRSWLGDTWWWKHVKYYLKKWARIRTTYIHTHIFACEHGEVDMISIYINTARVNWSFNLCLPVYTSVHSFYMLHVQNMNLHIT